jgi:plastocyanin
MKTTLKPLIPTLAAAMMVSAAAQAGPGHSHGHSHQAKPTPAARTLQVKIDNFSFLPASATVPVGTKVTWTNRDDMPHTVTSTDKRIASPLLDTDQTFSYTFTAPGAYAYYCGIHPKMTAQITVK